MLEVVGCLVSWYRVDSLLPTMHQRFDEKARPVLSESIIFETKHVTHRSWFQFYNQSAVTI